VIPSEACCGRYLVGVVTSKAVTHYHTSLHITIDLPENSTLSFKLRLAWLKGKNRRESTPAQVYFQRRWNYHICSFSGLGTVSPEDFMARSDFIVIIDEAHLSYSNRTFWLECIENWAANTVGPHLAMFASYGSASTDALSLLNTSPITLESQKRVSLTLQEQHGHGVALCFSIEEV
jgi:hypothetical protein